MDGGGRVGPLCPDNYIHQEIVSERGQPLKGKISNSNLLLYVNHSNGLRLMEM